MGNTKKKSTTTTKYTRKAYLDMLTYKRPQGSEAQTAFCKRYLEPVFGQPDSAGNYILRVGQDADIAFMSHHDTVHLASGHKVVSVANDFAKATGDDCLGADCTTGVYIMLRMIEAGVPGLYIVHAAEEVGCVGSRHIVNNTPDIVAGIKAAISFDRYGYKSIITHQMGIRTCSDDFAESLADVIGLGMIPDDTGVYTDSNEYAGIIPECTNVSVGYFKQHTNTESQDLRFMELLTEACISADWNRLVISRDPESHLYDEYTDKEDEGWWYHDDDHTGKDTDLTMIDIVNNYPEAVAEILKSWGYSADGLLDDISNLSHKYRH